jgi:uncharacterized protein YdiU (UPF0061 family)
MIELFKQLVGGDWHKCEPGATQSCGSGPARGFDARCEAVAPIVRAQAMWRVNPAFIPRNHRLEEALSAAVERADYAPFETLLNILSRPFDDQPEFAAFAEPAPEGQGCYQTFCGT